MYTVAGEDHWGNDPQGTVVVRDPTISVPATAPPGSLMPVSGGFWSPNARVAVVLYAPSGTEIGRFSMTADADGQIPAGTTVQIPQDANEATRTPSRARITGGTTRRTASR